MIISGSDVVSQAEIDMAKKKVKKQVAKKKRITKMYQKKFGKKLENSLWQTEQKLSLIGAPKFNRNTT